MTPRKAESKNVRTWRRTFSPTRLRQVRRLLFPDHIRAAMTWPPLLAPDVEKSLIDLAADYALSHGLVYRPPTLPHSDGPSTTTAIHAPYSLFPTPFPRHLFEHASELQPLYNALYAHVTVDDAFLDEVVGGAVAKVDDFQGKLYELWKKVSQEGIKQVSPVRLGWGRQLTNPTAAPPRALPLRLPPPQSSRGDQGPDLDQAGRIQHHLELVRTSRVQGRRPPSVRPLSPNPRVLRT